MSINNLLMNLSLDDKIELINLLEEKEYRESGRLRDKYFTADGDRCYALYQKHLEFFTAGAKYKQRIFSAGNRVGKTTAASYELVCHLTGEYPVWWQGKRFTSCNHWYVCGLNARTVKSILQDLLLGPVGSYGTGMIPRDSLDFDTLKDVKKSDGGVNIVRIKHATGAFSSIEFKTYESGRAAFEGVAKNVWMDEEPDISVYSEALLRTMTKTDSGDNQILMLTFTPLKGLSETILNFFNNNDFKTGEIDSHKYSVMCTWDDVPHLSQEDIAALWDSIPPFQRDARRSGFPSLGAGVVYPVSLDDYVIDPFKLPDDWPRFGGMDTGWARTAAVFCAQDPNSGIIYVYDEHYKGQAEASVHAESIKARGSWIPLAIDYAARGRSQVDGDSLYRQYTDLGLNIFNANKAVETGLSTCWELLSSRQIKVFSHCQNFLKEIRTYRRDEKGKIVKVDDHLMDAFRYAIMSGRDKATINPKFKQQQNINQNSYRPKGRFGI